jgi:hypothetical protein
MIDSGDAPVVPLAFPPTAFDPLELQQNHTSPPTIAANTTITPITIPATAPADIPGFVSGVGTGDDVGDVSVAVGDGISVDGVASFVADGNGVPPQQNAGSSDCDPIDAMMQSWVVGITRDPVIMVSSKTQRIKTASADA